MYSEVCIFLPAIDISDYAQATLLGIDQQQGKGIYRIRIFVSGQRRIHEAGYESHGRRRIHTTVRNLPHRLIERGAGLAMHGRGIEHST